MLVAARKVTHHDARQPVLALEPDQPVGQYGEGQKIDAGTVRNEVAPMRAIRGRERRDRDLEILRAVRIGEDEQGRRAAE